MNSGIKKLCICVAIIGCLIAAIRFFGLHEYITLQSIKDNRHWLTDMVAIHPYMAVFAYMLIFTTVIAIGLPAVGPLSLLGGFLFGVIPGTIYSVLSGVAGVMILFFFVRSVLAQAIGKHYSGSKLETFKQHFQAQGSSYLLTMHLAMVIPFFVIAVLAGLAHVPAATVFWTTLVGSFPLVFVYCFAGRQLGSIETIGDIFSPHIILALIMLGLLALVPVLIRRVREITDIS